VRASIEFHLLGYFAQLKIDLQLLECFGYESLLSHSADDHASILLARSVQF